MNKVKCEKGHFFDLDRFPTCPKCGAAPSGQPIGKSSGATVTPSRQSRLDPVDKTAILDESAVSAQPVSGKAAGIIWRFDSKNSGTPEADATVQTAEPVSVQSDRNSVSQTPAEVPVSEKKPETPVPAAEPPVSASLTQAVAATGHGFASALPKTVYYYDKETDDLEIEPVTGWLVCTKGKYRGQSFSCRTGRNLIGRNPSCRICLPEDNSITRDAHAIIIYEPKKRTFYLQTGTGSGLVYLNGDMLFTHEQLKVNDQIQIGNAEFLFIPLCGENFSWDT